MPSLSFTVVGTSCESSREFPCPNRAYTMKRWSRIPGLCASLDRGVRLWVCEWCEKALAKAGFESHEVRTWV